MAALSYEYSFIVKGKKTYAGIISSSERKYIIYSFSIYFDRLHIILVSSMYTIAANSYIGILRYRICWIQYNIEVVILILYAYVRNICSMAIVNLFSVGFRLYLHFPYSFQSRYIYS